MKRGTLLLATWALSCGGPEPASDTVELVQDLSMLALARPMDPSEAKEHASALDDGRIELGAYVDQLLDDPALGRVARRVILGGGEIVKPNHPIPSHSVLSHFDHEGERIYSLRGRCVPSTAVDVLPWWNRKKTIKVCPSAYRPEVLRDDEGRTCGASTLAPGAYSPCGCGPRLMFCLKDDDHRDEMRNSVRSEVTDTLAYVVNNDLPIEQLFLMNGTVRDRDAERIYVRSRVLAGESPDLMQVDGFSEKPRMASRHDQVDGHHAGILTTPGMLYGSDALRGVMRNYYEFLWCAAASSSGVTTQTVLGLDAVDLREGDGWQQLAGMAVCTDCHARLDYGMQFFQGYPSSTRGIDFRPGETTAGTGPLYNLHIGDPRGEDTLTPQGFARLVLTQPEFGECMARRVSDHVLGAQVTVEDYDAVMLAFEDSHSFRTMMRTALIRFADRAGSGAEEALSPRPGLLEPSESALADGAGAFDPTTQVRLSLEVAQGVDNHCAHCHDGIDQMDLTGGVLDRNLLNAMLEQVAFEKMPKGAGELDPAARVAFVEAMIDVLWTEDQARQEARAFFVGGQRAHPAHTFNTAMAAVASEAGTGKRLSIRGLSSAVDAANQYVSPGLLTSAALVALDACKRQGHSGDGLESCVAEATDPSVLILGPTGE